MSLTSMCGRKGVSGVTVDIFVWLRVKQKLKSTVIVTEVEDRIVEL